MRGSRASRGTAEYPDHLDMGRVPELIDRRDRLEPVAAGREGRRVPGEGAGVAGDADHQRDPGGGELPGLGFGARPGRIEHHRVEGVQLDRQQRPAEQVAALDGDPSQARGRAGGPVEGCAALAAATCNALPWSAIAQTEFSRTRVMATAAVAAATRRRLETTFMAVLGGLHREMRLV